MNNAFEKAGAPGVYSLMSMAGRQVAPGADARQPASRFATRGVVDGFLGPTFGLATDAVAAGSIPLRGASAALGGQPADVTPSDIATVRRLAPFASLPYWRWLIDGGFGFDYGAVSALKEAVRLGSN